MWVRLIKDVVEGDTLKVAKRRNRQRLTPDDPAFYYVPFVRGAVLEMSEASGNKYIDAGLAEPTERPAHLDQVAVEDKAT